MLNSLCVISVFPIEVGTKLKSGHIVVEDKNGKAPYIFKVIAGKAPNRTFQSGTITEKAKLELNKAYLMQVTETKPSDEHGRQFQWTKVTEMSALEVIDASLKLGNAHIIDVSLEEDALDAAQKELTAEKQ